MVVKVMAMCRPADAMLGRRLRRIMQLNRNGNCLVTLQRDEVTKKKPHLLCMKLTAQTISGCMLVLHSLSLKHCISRAAHGHTLYTGILCCMTGTCNLHTLVCCVVTADGRAVQQCDGLQA